MSALVSVPPSLPVDGMRLDEPLARLDAIRPGVHAKRAADGAGNAVKEGKTAEALFERKRGKPLVGQRRTGADAVAAGSRTACPKPFADKRTVDPSMPPSRTRRFEPTPMTVTGTAGSRCVRNAARSSASAGWNRSSAGPPTRNHVNGASARSA